MVRLNKEVINEQFIRKYNPCEEGIDNFTKEYPNFNGSLIELLSLEKIPYDDKMWLVTKIVDIKTLQQWSVECAEFVADNYNKVYPDDNRINSCIQTVKDYLVGNATRQELSAAESAAWAAASSAEWSALGSAAESASSAAMAAAESAESAARLAAESAESAESAAESAVWSARSAVWSARSAAKDEQESINISILIALLDNKEC